MRSEKEIRDKIKELCDIGIQRNNIDDVLGAHQCINMIYALLWVLGEER